VERRKEGGKEKNDDGTRKYEEWERRLVRSSKRLSKKYSLCFSLLPSFLLSLAPSVPP
jgi:hypothetical protein